jgi:hypothetical protein
MGLIITKATKRTELRLFSDLPFGVDFALFIQRLIASQTNSTCE